MKVLFCKYERRAMSSQLLRAALLESVVSALGQSPEILGLRRIVVEKFQREYTTAHFPAAHGPRGQGTAGNGASPVDTQRLIRPPDKRAFA